jgi:septum formation protein
MAFKNEIEVVLSTTLVEMMTLTDEQIEQYITSGEHRDKAGSYGIQGHAGAWIKRIEGSYSGVMGLPIFETAVLLRKAGIGIF